LRKAHEISMIPKIIHYCWLSNDNIPLDLQGYMNTWKEKLFDYEFVLWNFDRFDINSSIWVKQTFEAKKYAFAADFIRLFAVYNYGGIYLDMDIDVIKSFNPLLHQKYMFAYECNDTKYPEAGCFGAEKKFWFIGECMDYFQNREYSNTDKTYTLPRVMKEIYAKSPKEKIAFLAQDYFTAKSHVTGKVTITENTYCVHNFAASWLSDDERAFYMTKRKLCRIFGGKLGMIISFPLFVGFNVKSYGIKNGLKVVLDKVKFTIRRF